MCFSSRKKLGNYKRSLTIGLLAYWMYWLNTSFLTASQLNSSLKNVLFGYEPEQIARMIIQHQEVLDSLDEGLLAIDNLGVVSLLK